MSKKTLVVCFGPLGRLLNAFCASARLRAALPSEHLVLLTDPSLVGLASRSPWFDDIISADLNAADTNFSRLAKVIKQSKYDKIIDLDRSKQTASLFAAFGLFAPKFASNAPRAKWTFSGKPDHPIEEDDRLLDMMGIAKVEADLSLGPELDWLLRHSGKTPSLQPGYFRLEGEYILLNLGRPDPENGWPAAAFQTLAGYILGMDKMLAITGTIEAREMARPLLRNYPQIRDLCARVDAFQLANLGAKAKGVVGLPDGILHLCAVGSRRCISLHGSAVDAKRNAIRAAGAMTLISDPIEDLSADDVVKAMKMFGAL